MKFLFLYTELADYFLNCCKTLSAHGEVHIVRWPVNKEAPFQFDTQGLYIHEKQGHDVVSLQELIQKISPTVIVCSGWIDKDYLKAVKPWHGKVPTVMTCDTHWTGSLRQRIATVLSRIYLKRIFSHIWVPGQKQVVYARKLGYTEKQVLHHFYCCDLQRFNGIYERTFAQKRISFPKRFIYIGRYYEFKGITDLWQAFDELCRETDHDWELHCLGTGSLPPIQHLRIKHYGFVQPSQLEPILKETGVFILPSRFEPWAVVVQECAAAGFPMLLSDAIGARESFLEEGRNGFSFSKENVSELKESLKRILSLRQEELCALGENSHELAQKITPGLWAQTLLNLIHGKSSH